MTSYALSICGHISGGSEGDTPLSLSVTTHPTTPTPMFCQCTLDPRSYFQRFNSFLFVSVSFSSVVLQQINNVVKHDVTYLTGSHLGYEDVVHYRPNICVFKLSITKQCIITTTATQIKSIPEKKMPYTF